MIPLCVSSHIYMHSYSHSRFHTDCAEALEPGCLDQSLVSTVQCPLFLSSTGQSQPQGEKKNVYQQNERCNGCGRIYTTSPQNHSGNYTLHLQVCNFRATSSTKHNCKNNNRFETVFLVCPSNCLENTCAFILFGTKQHRLLVFVGFYLLATFIYSRFP